MKTSILRVDGILSPLGARGVEKRLGRVKGVAEASVNAVSGSALIAYDETLTSPASIRRAVEDCGYHCPGEAVPNHLVAKCLATRAPGERPRPPTPVGWRRGPTV